MSIERICPICGKNYSVPDWAPRHNRGLTCSYECGRKLAARKLSGPKKLVEFICQNCGKTLYLQPYLAKDKKYCSCKCAQATRQECTEVICARCDKRFQIPSWRTRRARRFFCSNECQFPKIYITCDWCGKVKRVSPSAVKEHNFCSRVCVGKWNTGRRKEHNKRLKVLCDNCGAELEREPNQVKRNKHNFCNRGCFGEWKSRYWNGKNNPVWRGGFEPYYGPNWKRQSQRTRARDEYKCQRCGVSQNELDKKLQVHHIIPLKTFKRDFRKANALSNLVSLCSSCHKYLEWHADEMKRFLASWCK